MKRSDINQIDDLLSSAAARMQEHDISGALDKLVQAYQIQPDNTLVLNMTGRCYQILGEFERAERCWEEALRLDPENNVAETNLKELRQPAFQFWLKRYKEALALLEKKKFSEAQELLRQLMEEHDEYVSLYQVLGLSYLAEGNRPEAHRVWRKGLEIDKQNSTLKKYLALPESRKKHLINEETSVQTQKRPIFTQRRLLILMGAICLVLLLQVHVLLSNQRQNAEYTEVLQQRIQQLTSMLDQQNQTPEETVPAAAVEEVSMEGSAYDTEQEEHYYRTGYQAYLDKDWQTAISNLGVVVSMQSGSYLNREALYYLARIHFLQKNYAEAEKYYLLYLESFPDSNYYDDSLFYLACTYHYTGRPQLARETLQRLTEWDPHSGYLSSSLYQSIMQQQ
ncbi:MAG TPA: tetratricopeptide repeat protein [Syntrophomonadaceae bacterium]|nr:tetratricopeptide repeat protein [Syntrophomonadaceae bacterium]HOQ09382.1 tetratricopeptide repeat protein [Syntrophomonadaceae bacterium]HPU48252.1 tetratricopeptide repeat protein [Syntrophomonadaceae bacterium]